MSDTTDEIGNLDRYVAHAQEKRRSNLVKSTKLLREHGVAFEAVNGGVHLVIRRDGRTWDFWPSTGRWRERRNDIAAGRMHVNQTSRESGRGVFRLLRAIGARPMRPAAAELNAETIRNMQRERS